jgi:hypothetical protein
MKTPGTVADPFDLDRCLEARDLAPVAVAAHGDVEHDRSSTGRAAVEHRRGSAGSAPRRCRRRSAHRQLLLQGRRAEPDVLSRCAIVVDSPARQHEPVQALELVASPHGTTSAPSRLQRRDVLTHVALEGEHANARALPTAFGETDLERARSPAPRIAAPRPVETLATTPASREVRGRLDDGRAMRTGSSLLKMPDPTKTASAPSCRTSEASAGVEMPPAQNSGTGQLPRRGDLLDERERRAQVLGPARRARRVGALRAGASAR